jgi:hypothetical protein
MTRFSRPRATGGRGFAHYDYQWSQIGLRISTKRMQNPQQAALVLVAIFKRSGQTRARVSAQTIKIVAARKHLRRAFLAELTDALAEYSWTLAEIDNGGYAAVKTKTLETAKPATAKRWLTADELRALKRATVKWSVFEREAAPEQEQPEENEDV